MNAPNKKRGGAPRGVLLAIPLAILSSLGSIAVAVVGGWQRGAVMPGQLLMPGINVIAVLGALLLPTLWGRLAGVLKAWCIVLWLLCMCWSVQGHAWFLMDTQERAAVARAEAVRLKQPPLAPPGRDVATILNDKAKLTEKLARLSAGACEVASCVDPQRLRMAALTQRLDALDAEAQSVAEIRQSRQRQAEQQRRAEDDLVGIRLAGLLRLPYASVIWLMSLAFAVILEGVGCLCWAVVFRIEPTAPGPALVTADETVVTAGSETETIVPRSMTSVTQEGLNDSLEVTSVSAMQEARDLTDDSPSVMPGRTRQIDQDVARVIEAVRASVISLTVTQVRQFLRCSQGHARQIRKVISETSADLLTDGA